MSTLELPLEERVHSALKLSPHLTVRKLRCEAGTGGRIVLKGTVGSYYHKQMAQEMLRRLDGVEEIANELQVSWA
jgi:osmotically-inducible protein OsmY